MTATRDDESDVVAVAEEDHITDVLILRWGNLVYTNLYANSPT